MAADISAAEPLADGYSTRIFPMVIVYQTWKDTALLVVSEAPGAEEDQTGDPFIGRSGQLLRGAYIDHFGLGDHADVYLAYTVRCRPPNNRTPKPREIKKHLPYLLEDLNQLCKDYKRVVVFAIGATACKAFGFKSLSTAFKSQGAPLSMELLTDDKILGKPPHFTFFTTFHPAYILRDATASPAVEAHLGCLLRHLTGAGTKLLSPVVAGAPPTPFLEAPATLPVDTKLVCLDIETVGCLAGREQSQFHPVKLVCWDSTRAQDVLVSCALSWRKADGTMQSAFYNLTVPLHRRALCAVLRELQDTGGTLLLQNATFDLTFLRAFMPACTSYLEPPLRLADLMVASYLVDEVRPEKSLKALSPLLMGASGLYSDEWRALNFRGPTDPELPLYNIADTERTLACYDICRNSYTNMYGPDTNKGGDYSDRWYSDLLHLVTWMAETGVPIDEPALVTLDAHLVARQTRLERLARDHLGLILGGKGSDGARRSAVSDAAALVPGVIAGQIELTKTGMFPFDEETRNLLMPEIDRSTGPRRGAWRKLHVIGLHQSVSKLVNTFTGPMLRGRTRAGKTNHAPRIIKGRIYPVWFPTPREFGNVSGGVKQGGRLSAKDPAVQTFPPCVKKLIRVDAWADYSGIELRVAALMSGDPVMMAEFSGSDGDLHTRTARGIFGDTFVNDYIALHGQAAWKHGPYRHAGKTTNFAMLNLGGAEVLHAQLLKEVGFDYPVDKCYHAIQDFWNLYRGLREYIDQNIATVKQHGFLELPLIGQSRHYDRAYPAINEVANQPFQCIAANILESAQYHMWCHAKAEGVGMTCPVNIHDAVGIVLLPHERRYHGMTRARRIMADVLPNPPYFLDLCAYLGRTIPLDYEVTQ